MKTAMVTAPMIAPMTAPTTRTRMRKGRTSTTTWSSRVAAVTSRRRGRATVRAVAANEETFEYQAEVRGSSDE